MLGWNSEDFLHTFFASKTKTSTRSQRHRIITEKFRGRYTTGELLWDLWTTVDGSGEDTNLYCINTPYAEIGPVRTMLSSFAAQIIEKQLVYEAQKAVKPSGGLHASVRSKDSGAVTWSNIGAGLIPTVQKALQQHQPLALYYLNHIAEPNRPQEVDGTAMACGMRPSDLISRNTFAKIWIFIVVH